MILPGQRNAFSRQKHPTTRRSVVRLAVLHDGGRLLFLFSCIAKPSVVVRRCSHRLLPVWSLPAAQDQTTEFVGQ